MTMKKMNVSASKNDIYIANMLFSRSQQGTIHQANINEGMFGRASGSQCTAVALISLIFASYHISPSTWGQQHIDFVVSQGDELYHGIIGSNYHGNVGTFLAHSDIPDTVSLLHSQYNIQVLPMFYGVISNEHGTIHASGAMSIDVAVQQFFNTYTSLLCTFGELSVGVFSHNGYYYMFDSHARDFRGYFAVDGSGAAVLLEFVDIQSLIEYLRDAYSGQIFNISPVEIDLLTNNVAANIPRSTPNALVQPATIEHIQMIAAHCTDKNDEVNNTSAVVQNVGNCIHNISYSTVSSIKQDTSFVKQNDDEKNERVC
eukprot:GHVU01119996.1.p1 GENE.GHVU01119996.1~~GHVU01119996.1.p1  ORF type:complete len:315 (-),score=21.60 GHVU01119996.1:88-1032(-)